MRTECDEDREFVEPEPDEPDFDPDFDGPDFDPDHDLCDTCQGDGFVFCKDGSGGTIGMECPEC